MVEPLTKKQLTRQRILNAAGATFRQSGFTGIGVDGVAKEAGVTSGALYAHFGSKNGLFEEALKAGLDEVIEAIPQFRQDSGAQWIEAFVTYYLGQAHRDDLAGGCAMTTLSPEVVRAAPEIHALYESKMNKIAGLIATGLAQGSEEEKLARAWSVLGALIGGLTLARAVKTRKLSGRIAAALSQTAVMIAGPAA
ncbi:MAG: TetR/AcrR family transcriptional regulator [Parvibaculaceae bacterium]|nr:TetR/AcrR family transcriptional regulator [Parvibaculaceae bacterium]